jgi:hypothetical protein
MLKKELAESEAVVAEEEEEEGAVQLGFLQGLTEFHFEL